MSTAPFEDKGKFDGIPKDHHGDSHLRDKKEKLPGSDQRDAAKEDIEKK
ncbi:hypothetical protein [Aquimarina brevivitae]|uniref:Uncharacterized protein n=1 Tax=Aquimarina brevivitae TaxID=323412 RepID=A0A4Q7PIZ2_9FLAO|nr:hypothetical protein [Aquimarina brevivitae]RZT00238.1 hypothetical protein EV197_1474 [Aquimarina brevivitae]